MNKFLYPILHFNIKPWIKYWLYNKEVAPEPVYPLSEIITGTSPLTLENGVRKNFNVFNISGNTIQDGTPTPESPIPIQNVSGEVEVKVENKNLFDGEFEIGGINGTTGRNESVSNAIRSINYIDVDNKTQVAISVTPSISGTLYMLKYDGNYNYLGFTKVTNGTTYNLSSTKYIRISNNNNTNLQTKLQVEIGSATSYEPHEEQTATFPLAEGQVLHLGDTLEEDGIHVTQRDFEFTQTVIDNDITIEAQAQGTNTYRIKMGNSYAPILINYNITTIKSSHFKGIPRNDRTIAENNLIYGDVTENKCFFIIRNTEFASENALKTFLENQYTNGNPVRIQYLRATPVVIPYTAEQQTAYNNLKDLYSYKGTTYISSSNAPSPVFEVQYYMEGE